MQKKPSILTTGDVIHIVAPASSVEKSYIENATRSLQSLGYNVIVGDHVLCEYHQFAGNDKERKDDFQLALDDEQAKAIFCARGGYGSIRIVDSLDFTQFKKEPKWIVGFSDITIFHVLVNQHFHLPSLHAPMPVNFSSPWFNDNFHQLNQLLTGNREPIEIISHKLNRAGKCKGTLVGGNLSILYSLQSTPYEIETHNKILFIEDVGEQLYHLDRIMNNFRLADKFRDLKGLIVGGLTDMKDKKRPFGKTPEQIIRKYIEPFDIPVAFGFPAGHMENNVPFVLGCEVELEVGEDKVVLEYV